MKQKPAVIDLFAGAGGFSRGFSYWFEIIVALEKNHDAARTYASNFPTTLVLEEDIAYFNWKQIKLINSHPKIVIGSPPCEAFTAANPKRKKEPLSRLYEDERGLLTLEYIRVLKEINPCIFVMENVPSLVEHGELRDELSRLFDDAGYPKVFFNILRAENYGNPSRRTRVFISNIEIKPQIMTKRITVYEAIRDLMEINDVPNHEKIAISDEKLRKIVNLSFNEYMSMYEGSGKKIPLYRRLDPNEIAPTVMGGSRFIHPFEDRFLTVREQARLMLYPDFHVFYGSRDEQYNQVGESVPVSLSNAIARYIRGKYEDICGYS
ncbi:restriction endonuclease subunit M [Sulfolobales archaeon HS-7]|nr:restriction endonuclease subunit M [Sulfolobales archaeon HS-7]